MALAGGVTESSGAAVSVAMVPAEYVSIHRVERIALFLGLIFLGIWFVGHLDCVIFSRAAIAQFNRQQIELTPRSMTESADPILRSNIDFRLWSEKRVAGYQESLNLKHYDALAVLRIAKINVEVPVFNGTDELTLNRGVGRIEGTAQLGRGGNLGIAGHRDGFFRALKDIALGDLVELSSAGRTDFYAVTQIRIVKPEDTSVLKPTVEPTLTLVTCFPFYYVGSAPERYVVTASILDSGQRIRDAQGLDHHSQEEDKQGEPK